MLAKNYNKYCRQSILPIHFEKEEKASFRYSIPYLFPTYLLSIASSSGTFLPKRDHKEGKGMNTFGSTPQITSQNPDCDNKAACSRVTAGPQLVPPRETGWFALATAQQPSRHPTTHKASDTAPEHFIIHTCHSSSSFVCLLITNTYISLEFEPFRLYNFIFFFIILTRNIPAL